MPRVVLWPAGCCITCLLFFAETDAVREALRVVRQQAVLERQGLQPGVLQQSQEVVQVFVNTVLNIGVSPLSVPNVTNSILSSSVDDACMNLMGRCHVTVDLWFSITRRTKPP
jgi:hypothetical protein